MITINTTPQVISRSQTLFDPSSAQPNYIGKASEGLPTSSGGWFIYYFIYNGKDITSIQTGLGSWDNRASVVYS